MKKVIIVLFVMIIIPSIGHSENTLKYSDFYDKNDRVISKFTVDEKASYDVRVLCIDGHKFVSMARRTHEGVTASIVQKFEERDGKSLPAKC